MRTGADQSMHTDQTVHLQRGSWWLSDRVLASGGRLVTGSKLTGDTALCLSARHFILSLVLFQHRKTGICPNITEKLLTET